MVLIKKIKPLHETPHYRLWLTPLRRGLIQVRNGNKEITIRNSEFTVLPMPILSGLNDVNR